MLRSKALLAIIVGVAHACSIVLIAAVVGWLHLPSYMKLAAHGRIEGRLQAEWHLMTGTLGWRTLGGWGYPDHEPYRVVDMSDVLQRDYGVQVFHTKAGSGCTPPPDEAYLWARLEAYNARMKPAIERRHGPHVFATAEARAELETKDNEFRCERGDESRCWVGSL